MPSQTPATILNLIQDRLTQLGSATSNAADLVNFGTEIATLRQIDPEAITITPVHTLISNTGASPITGVVPSGKWFIYFDTITGSATVNGQTYQESWFDSETFKFLQRGIVYGEIAYSVPVGSTLRFTYFPD